MKNRKISIIATLDLLALGFSTCKHSSDSTPAPTKDAVFAFHLHTNVDTAEVDAYGDTLDISTGGHVIVSRAALYISNVKLVKTDGSLVPVEGTILTKAGKELYVLSGKNLYRELFICEI
jgi:hypothetical protein